MDRQTDKASDHVVPTYRAPSDAAWYHFLHGNVPGHQIDFMYRAEVPQGPLTRQHFSHLSRIMKYIEPQAGAPYAFAIANLSRDDTQYEPGRGGLAMIFGHRVQGTRDHAGRQDPPFAHAIAAVNRELTSASLLSVALSFYRFVLRGEPAYDCPSNVMYREYARCLFETSRVVPDVLRTYLSGFSELPQPPESSLSLRWLRSGARQTERVVIVHPDGAPFSAIAACASRIAGVLYQSDVRWTAITSGRELEVANGVTIRLVAHRDASSYSSEGRALLMSEVPEEEAGIAKLLFGAAPIAPRAYPVAPLKSRERQPRRAVGSPSSAEPTVPGAGGSKERTLAPAAAPEVSADRVPASSDEAPARTPNERTEGETAPNDAARSPSDAKGSGSAEEALKDECQTLARTPPARSGQDMAGAPSKSELLVDAYEDVVKTPSDSDSDDDDDVVRVLYASRRPRAWLRVSVVLGGAVALPFIYISWSGLPFGDVTTLERRLGPSEQARAPSSAEVRETAEPATQGGAPAGGRPGAMNGGAPALRPDRSRPLPKHTGKVSAVKGATSQPVTSPVTPPVTPPSTAASAAAGPSIIGAPPIFASATNGKP